LACRPGKAWAIFGLCAPFLVACVQQSALPPDGPALLGEMEPQRPPVAEYPPSIAREAAAVGLDGRGCTGHRARVRFPGIGAGRITGRISFMSSTTGTRPRVRSRARRLAWPGDGAGGNPRSGGGRIFAAGLAAAARQKLTAVIGHGPQSQPEREPPNERRFWSAAMQLALHRTVHYGWLIARDPCLAVARLRVCSPMA